jgi:hypothetical protein
MQHIVGFVHGQTAHVAHNVPLSANPVHNPELTNYGLLGRFLETWERIFVLCHRKTCAVHRPEGGPDGRRMWWPSIQRRVVVFDAADLDHANRHILRWAGCERANQSVHQQLQKESEPCVFQQRGGGNDWRRTSKHRLAALLAHLTLVERAAQLKLSNVLILEADVVPTMAVAQLSDNRTRALLAAGALSRALQRQKWSILRLSGMFYSQEFAPGVRPAHGTRATRRCSRQCLCSSWKGGAEVQAVLPQLRTCEVAGASKSSDQIMPMVADMNAWCDVRDTAAYAVHGSSYDRFSSYLQRLRALPQWLRNGANDVPAIDNWIPHAFSNLYVLPTLATQPSVANDSQGATALLRQTSAQHFKHFCARSLDDATPYPSPLSHSAHRDPKHANHVEGKRAMKLSTFATRHLYVLNDRALGRSERLRHSGSGSGRNERLGPEAERSDHNRRRRARNGGS